MLAANSICPRSHRKWSDCQIATAVSRVTPLDESIEIVQYCRLGPFHAVFGDTVMVVARSISVDNSC